LNTFEEWLQLKESNRTPEAEAESLFAVLRNTIRQHGYTFSDAIDDQLAEIAEHIVFKTL